MTAKRQLDEIESMVASAYEGMSPGERITRTIHAFAADDADEGARLQETAPQRTYLMGDAAYFDPLERAADMALVVGADLRELAARLETIQALREIFAGEGRPAMVAEDADAAMGAARECIASEFRGVWDGFDTFCADTLGVTGEQMIETWARPHAWRFAEIIRDYADVDPDAESQRQYLAMLREAWSNRFGEEATNA